MRLVDSFWVRGSLHLIMVYRVLAYPCIRLHYYYFVETLIHSSHFSTLPHPPLLCTVLQNHQHEPHAASFG
jgi:hypothetical protein